MASIGLIVRADSEVAELPVDWVPEPLGNRSEVEAVVERYFSARQPSLHLELRVEAAEESENPRTIAASGVWGEHELAVVRNICQSLDARFYDAEASEFIAL